MVNPRELILGQRYCVSGIPGMTHTTMRLERVASRDSTAGAKFLFRDEHGKQRHLDVRFRRHVAFVLDPATGKRRVVSLHKTT